MCNEIEVRAWSKSENKMIHWRELLSHPRLADILAGYFLKTSVFTGRRDKNDAKIFDGDIVQCEGFTGLVYFHEGHNYFCWKEISSDKYFDASFNDWARNSEIIGNIYENPGLKATA